MYPGFWRRTALDQVEIAWRRPAPTPYGEKSRGSNGVDARTELPIELTRPAAPFLASCWVGRFRRAPSARSSVRRLLFHDIAILTPGRRSAPVKSQSVGRSTYGSRSANAASVQGAAPTGLASRSRRVPPSRPGGQVVYGIGSTRSWYPCPRRRRTLPSCCPMRCVPPLDSWKRRRRRPARWITLPCPRWPKPSATCGHWAPSGVPCPRLSASFVNGPRGRPSARTGRGLATCSVIPPQFGYAGADRVRRRLQEGGVFPSAVEDPVLLDAERVAISTRCCVD